MVSLRRVRRMAPAPRTRYTVTVVRQHSAGDFVVDHGQEEADTTGLQGPRQPPPTLF